MPTIRATTSTGSAPAEAWTWLSTTSRSRATVTEPASSMPRTASASTPSRAKVPGLRRTLRVTVRPKKAGKAKLQRLNTDTFRWKSVRSVRITRAGRAKVTVPKAGGVFRVTVLATKKLAAGESRSLRFR